MGCIFLSGVPLMVSNVDAICPNPLCTANDLDGDGLTNRDESFKYRTAPENPDTDGDRLNDGAEVRSYGFKPLLFDTLGDRLQDGKEVLGWYFAIDASLPCPKPGYTCVFHHTSPVKADTDDEGCTDYWEYRNNYDPLDSVSITSLMGSNFMYLSS